MHWRLEIRLSPSRNRSFVWKYIALLCRRSSNSGQVYCNWSLAISSKIVVHFQTIRGKAMELHIPLDFFIWSNSVTNKYNNKEPKSCICSGLIPLVPANHFLIHEVFDIRLYECIIPILITVLKLSHTMRPLNMTWLPGSSATIEQQGFCSSIRVGAQILD